MSVYVDEVTFMGYFFYGGGGFVMIGLFYCWFV